MSNRNTKQYVDTFVQQCRILFWSELPILQKKFELFWSEIWAMTAAW